MTHPDLSRREFLRACARAQRRNAGDQGQRHAGREDRRAATVATQARSPRAGDDFALFAQEISDRIESGRVEVERFAADVAALHDQLSAALVQEQALAGECERLIPTVPDALAASGSDIAGHHEKVARVAAEVRALAQDIQRKVGSALAALQVGDSTRQRIEHVQQGLRLPRKAPIPS